MVVKKNRFGSDLEIHLIIDFNFYVFHLIDIVTTHYLSLISTSREARNVNTVTDYRQKRYQSKKEAWKKEIDNFIKENSAR